MEEIRPFQKKVQTGASPGSYDLEFSGRPIKSVGIRYAATIAGAGIATVRDDAAFRQLKTPEVNQAESPLIRMRGQSWRHLSAILDGRYDNHVAGTGNPSPIAAHAIIHLERLMPGAMINGADKKVFFRGDFGLTTDYAGTPPATITGTLKPYVITSQRIATKGFLRPRISEKNIAVVSQADDQQDVIRFEQDVVCAGLMLTCDDSVAGNPRTDGLIRSLRIDHATRDQGTIEIFRASWGQIRALMNGVADFNQEDYNRSVGVGLIPFKDRSRPEFNGAQVFRAGESITLHIDSLSAIEEDFTTATFAAGAQVVVTLLNFNSVSATGDSAAQLTEVKPPVAQLAAATPLNSREKRRLARLGAQ